MEYGQGAQAVNGNYGVGAALGAAGQFKQSVEPPRTISSAASRLDALNGRLSKISEALSQISAQIGAVNPIPNKLNRDDQCAAAGAVHRLNDSADAAHNQLIEIETLVASIGRALG